MLWYQKFCSDLEEIEFQFNEYDPCISTKLEKGSQHLIRFHVNDILSSDVLPQVNDNSTNERKVSMEMLREFRWQEKRNLSFLG